jgi:hypothetical protein
MVKIVKMKGGVSGAGIGLILLIVLIVIIVGSVGVYFLFFNCTEVTKECEDDDDCCNSLKCKSKKCCSTSTKVCSKDNECCGTLKCKDTKCTETPGPEVPGPEVPGPPGTTPTPPTALPLCNINGNTKVSSCDAVEQLGCESLYDSYGRICEQIPGGNKRCRPSGKACKLPPTSGPKVTEPESCFEKCTNIGGRLPIYGRAGSLCNDKTKFIPIDKEPLFESKALECCPGSSLYKPSCSNGAFKGRRWGGGAGYVGPAEGNFITSCGTHEYWYCK